MHSVTVVPALALFGRPARALRFTGLWLRGLRGSAHFLVGLTPIERLLVDERPVALKRGAEFDRRHLGLRVDGIRAAVALGDRGAGKQERRHCKNSHSHSSLNVDMRAGMRAKRARPYGARRLSQTSEG